MTTKMMSAALMVGAALVLNPLNAATAANAAPETAKAHYSVADTPLGTLLDDPASHAVLAADVPKMLESPQLPLARPLTLQQLQVYDTTMLSDKVLQKIDADLAKLPVKN